MGTDRLDDKLLARITERAADPDRRTNNSGIRSQAVDLGSVLGQLGGGQFGGGGAALQGFMGQFADVEALDERRMHWRTPEVMGQALEWDAEITEEQPGELLCWRSTEDAPLKNEGEVRFGEAPQARGTEVRLVMRFDPPGSALGRAAIKAMGPTPRLLASHALRRFKSLAETGEIATLHHNPSGRADGTGAAGT